MRVFTQPPPKPKPALPQAHCGLQPPHHRGLRGPLPPTQRGQTQGPRGPKPPLKTAPTEDSQPKVNTNDVLDFARTRPRSAQLLFCDDIWWHIGMQTDPFGLLAILRSCKLLYYIFQDENLWIYWLKTIRIDGWEDPFKAAYDLEGKSWRLCPLGKCKARYVTYLKDVGNAFIDVDLKLEKNEEKAQASKFRSKDPPTCSTCYSKKFDHANQFAFARAIVAQNRYFCVQGQHYYLCHECYLKTFKCKTCREEFVMDGKIFKQLVLGENGYVGGRFSTSQCHLPFSESNLRADYCHPADYVTLEIYNALYSVYRTPANNYDDFDRDDDDWS